MAQPVPGGDVVRFVAANPSHDLARGPVLAGFGHHFPDAGKWLPPVGTVADLGRFRPRSSLLGNPPSRSCESSVRQIGQKSSRTFA